MKYFIIHIIKLILYLFFLTILPFIWVVCFFTTVFYKREKLSIVWGPVPLVNIVYWSEAIQKKGYRSKTIVSHYYLAQEKSVFDVVYSAYWWGRGVFQLFTPYFVFVYLLFWADVFCFSFDGGFLQNTPFKFWECNVLKLFKKKTVVYAYGSDSLVYSRIRDFLIRDALIRHYPEAGKKESLIIKQINYFCGYADFIISSIFHLEPLPKWDLLLPNICCINTSLWINKYKPCPRGKSFRILHCPNHRYIKGTDFLIQACEELRREGLDIKLILVEKKSNTYVLEQMKNCHVLAAEFILPGYALNEIEGMSMGLPVMANLSSSYYIEYFKLRSFLSECPILPTPIDKIKDNIKILYYDPILCNELGRKNRDYVRKYHSLDFFGRLFDGIIQKIVYAKDVDFDRLVVSSN